MKKIEDEQLTDEIIGEAALSLLKEKGPINKQSLIRKLQAMEAEEGGSQRGRLIGCIITQLRDEGKKFPGRENVRENSEWDNSNVYPIFGDKRQSNPTKKH